MQQVAKAEATVLLMRAQAGKKIEKPIAKKKAPVMRTFIGPDGEYQLQKPKNFNEAMASQQAPQWWDAMAKAIMKFEVAGHFVPTAREAVPAGTKVWQSTWALSYKKDAETGELREYSESTRCGHSSTGARTRRGCSSRRRHP